MGWGVEEHCESAGYSVSMLQPQQHKTGMLSSGARSSHGASSPRLLQPVNAAPRGKMVPLSVLKAGVGGVRPRSVVTHWRGVLQLGIGKSQKRWFFAGVGDPAE